MPAMTTTYRPVRMLLRQKFQWALKISSPGQAPELHGHYANQAEAQAEADRLAARDDDATKTDVASLERRS
jgi:uncharacterized protein YciW